jgi:DNA adenine methylase
MNTDILKQLQAMWAPPPRKSADATPTAPLAVTAVAKAQPPIALHDHVQAACSTPNTLPATPATLPVVSSTTEPANVGKQRGQALTNPTKLPSTPITQEPAVKAITSMSMPNMSNKTKTESKRNFEIAGQQHVADKPLPSPLKWHGGKTYQAKRIIELMPPHIHYVEPYCGGLSVLLAKNPAGVSEVVNDRNGNLVNFFRVLQREALFEKFRRIVEATPFSQQLFEDGYGRLNSGMVPATDDERVERAVDFFIVNRQSYSGRMMEFTVLSKTRTRRDMNEQCSAWLTAIDGLPELYERLRRVVILNRPALRVIESEDGPGTLFYLDPPYLPETRASQGQYGPHEMSDQDHLNLLAAIVNVEGKVMLSGYPNKMYGEALADWNRHEHEQKKHSSGSKTKSIGREVLWMNF